MLITIAPDKFKGSLTAREVSNAIAAGIREVYPQVQAHIVPLADGGEGTVDAALENGFTAHVTRASGPLGTPLDATWAQRGETAVIEMAAASGLELLPEADRDALRASTRGTGDMIRDALEHGATRIMLAVGGSASTDGGAGMLSALGARILDAEGTEVADGGAALAQVAQVDLSGLDSRIRNTTFILASDVDHILLGEYGAAHVFGPQKGASPEQVLELDSALGIYADALEAAVGRRVRDLPSAGAAGGIGFGAMAVLNATQQAGVEVVVDFTGLRETAQGSHLLITGEGSFDEQSLGGKTPMGVARLGAALDIPVAAVVGRSLLTDSQWREAGFTACYAVADRAPDAAASIKDAAIYLRTIGREIAQTHLSG